MRLSIGDFQGEGVYCCGYEPSIVTPIGHQRPLSIGDAKAASGFCCQIPESLFIKNKMSRLSWSSSSKEGRIQLGERQASDYEPSKRNVPVPKAALEDGILHLLATAAEMQQRQDLESANQLYEAAIVKIKAHGLDRNKFLTGTRKKPAPLNSRTALEWSIHVDDINSAITLIGDPNSALTQLLPTLNHKQIEKIFLAGANIEQRVGPFGRTFLLREASEARLEGIELALAHGANVSCMDDNGDTALALALRTNKGGSLRAVSALLDAGADPNTKDGQGLSLLKVAAAHASPEVVEQIIKYLSPSTTDDQKHLQECVADLPLDGKRLSSRTISVIMILLEHGLDSNTRLSTGGALSLLDLALQQPEGTSEDLVLRLIENGANIDLESALQRAQTHPLELILTRLTPLSDANKILMTKWAQSALSSNRQWSKRDGGVLGLLLDFGLDPNIRSEKAPRSPLVVLATANGDLSLVERLVAHKANLTVANDNSDTAIVTAAKQKNRQIYDVLKAGGVNDQYFFGWTVWTSYAKS